MSRTRLSEFQRPVKWLLPGCLACCLAWSGCTVAQTVRDDLGNTLPARPAAQRIITLSPHATEIVQAIGAQDLLVAVAGHSTNIADSVPRISALGGMDRERVMQLQPDLVIAWASGNKPADLRWLQHRGIRVYQTEPTKLAQLADSMRAIGVLTDRLEPAERAANQFDRTLAQACRNQRQTEVYLSIWAKPAMTVGGAHWLNDVLQHAGMRNTYAMVQRGIFSVEAESLLARQPLLRLSSHPPADTKVTRQITIQSLSRPGPGIVSAIQQLCRYTGN